MAPGIPSVVGPITEWASTVLVEGCLPGATITIATTDGQSIATAVSDGGSDQVPIPVGAPLTVGQRLVASQQLNADTSATTPDELAVAVSASPTNHNQLPPLTFRSRLFECGRAVWLAGAAPGAVVTVTRGGTTLGTARADTRGDARVALTASLPGAGTVIEATQAAPAGFPALVGAPAVTSARTRALPEGPLPAPTLRDPMPLGCEGQLLIGGVIDGAQVTVTRSSDDVAWTATFEVDEEWFLLGKPFPAEGDHVAITQFLPACRQHDLEPSRPAEADIAPAAAPPPVSIAPPCAGSTLLHVDSLRGGAPLTVTITVPTISVVSLAYVAPPGRTSWDIPVPPLPSGSTVQVTESVCSFQTSTTAPVIDDVPPHSPDLAVPLYSCGRAVSVKTRAGTFIEIWADSGSGPAQISARIRADRALVTVQVFPYLTEPQTVWTHQLSCGGLQQDSPTYNTEAHPPLQSVELRDPLIAGMATVAATNAVSGAHVTVLATNDELEIPEILGERDITAADPVVPLHRRLTERDTVWALQEICGDSTEDDEQHRYGVLRGEMVFTMPGPRTQISGLSDDGALVYHSATFACRYADASWLLFVDAENTETGYDGSTVFGVALNLPAPYHFGGSVDVDLAAADNGLPIGLASLGYPSRATVTRRSTSNLLQDNDLWAATLTTTAQWITHFVGWRNYEPPPEKSDWIDGDNAPPDPNQLFPPLPIETSDAPDYWVKHH